MARLPNLGRSLISPLSIALGYAVVSAVWIVFSDRFLALVGADLSLAHLTRIQTLKGLLYIALTAGFIYLLVGIVTRQVASSRQELEEVETRYLQLFEKAGAVILLVDSVNGRIVGANRAAERFYGWTREQLMERTLADLEVQLEPGPAPETVSAADEGHFSPPRHRHASGEERDVSINGTEITTGDRKVNLLLIHDTTERRLLERQLRQAQKLEAVGQLTGGIAHDLNNVLTVVLADADLIAAELGDSRRDVSADLDDLRTAARRGASMIRKLLSFSRSANLHMVSLDLCEAVGELESTIRGLLPEAIALEMKTSATGPVKADPFALEQILFNLATNARDAMRNGGTFSVECGRSTLAATPQAPWVKPGDYVFLKVRDTGVGMDARTRSRIFEPFFTTKPPSEGTGLGMAMIYGLVKQHEGFVFVDSRPGAGTTVTIHLPASPLLDRMDHSGPMGPPESATGGETILLVEDEDALRRAGQRILERLGYVVIPAEHGEEALAILSQPDRNIDLVVSDIIMPKVGGRALYEAAQARQKNIRFLFTSGYAGLGGAESAPLLEVPFLQKPWTFDELGRKVREVLDRKP